MEVNEVLVDLTKKLVEAIKSGDVDSQKSVITEFRNNGVSEYIAMAMAKFVIDTDNKTEEALPNAG